MKHVTPSDAKNRAETIRISQAARRKRLGLKSVTVEIDAVTHKKIRDIANKKNITLQDLMLNTIKSMLLPEINNNPWDIFEEQLDETNAEYTHVSLFAGCGGFDLGFRQAGFKTILANDIDPNACQTYRKNIGPIIEQDIRTLELIKPRRRPDVITAGFPCQPFSNAGSRKGVSDERGMLYQTAIEIVQKLNPRAVVFENVRGLLSSKHDGELLIETICRQLDNLGYEVTFSLVDASKHNVPQKRLRVLIVGTEKKKQNGKFVFPKPIERKDLALSNTILDLTPDVLNQSEIIQLNPQAIAIGDMVPEGGSWKSIPYENLPPRLQKIWDNIERYRWPKFYRRYHRDEIAGTITAAFKPENAGVWHPIEKRPFSVREIARIQSFPDWFEFLGKNVKSKYQQIGNAIPPRLAYEIALQLTKVLQGENLRNPSDNYITFDDFKEAGKPLRACDMDVIYK